MIWIDIYNFYIIVINRNKAKKEWWLGCIEKESILKTIVCTVIDELLIVQNEVDMAYDIWHTYLLPINGIVAGSIPTRGNKVYLLSYIDGKNTNCSLEFHFPRLNVVNLNIILLDLFLSPCFTI